MKVLYDAFKHDPRNPDLASGVDHGFYNAILQGGFDVRIQGPLSRRTVLVERALKRWYNRWTGKRYAKFPMSWVWRAGKALNRVERSWKPDVVFTIFPGSLVSYRGKAPCIYGQDLSFLNWQKNYPEFGNLALRLCVWQEKRAFAKCSRIITHSENARQALMQMYGIEPERIEMFPLPCALPKDAVPRTLENGDERLDTPLRLLLVGRDYRRKGIDVAIETARQLNASGTPADLTVCGTNGSRHPHVRFVGPYRKSDPEQLKQYVELYRQSHFLLHPALFDASPTVPSEAAAFGTPTITNDTGGCGTSVADGESGVVLPKGSKPEAYARVIVDFLRNPRRYQELRISTRKRYQRELNWDVAGKRVREILEEVVAERSAGGRA